MRILLDAVHGKRWDEVVTQRPAYAHIETDKLKSAIALAQDVANYNADLWALNAQSLGWRVKT